MIAVGNIQVAISVESKPSNAPKGRIIRWPAVPLEALTQEVSGNFGNDAV
jgi:hypothetical protein